MITTDEENNDSIKALELMEEGIPGAVASESALVRGLDRGLYTKERVSAARKAYPEKMDEWMRRVGTGRSTTTKGPVGKSIGDDKSSDLFRKYNLPADCKTPRDYLTSRLDILLGHAGERFKHQVLTTENFSKERVIVEQLFSLAQDLGVDKARELEGDYRIELIQSSGGPDNPSEGRLGYIKEHLEKLRSNTRSI